MFYPYRINAAPKGISLVSAIQLDLLLPREASGKAKCISKLIKAIGSEY